MELLTTLGEPELGALLLCAGDLHVAAVGAADVQLSRGQTLMQGAIHCEFCYRIER